MQGGTNLREQTIDGAHGLEKGRDRALESLLLGGVPGERLDPERDAAVADGDEVEHELLGWPEKTIF